MMTILNIDIFFIIFHLRQSIINTLIHNILGKTLLEIEGLLKTDSQQIIIIILHDNHFNIILICEALSSWTYLAHQVFRNFLLCFFLFDENLICYLHLIVFFFKDFNFILKFIIFRFQLCVFCLHFIVLTFLTFVRFF